jgi:hypothetical protein
MESEKRCLAFLRKKKISAMRSAKATLSNTASPAKSLRLKPIQKADIVYATTLEV